MNDVVIGKLQGIRDCVRRIREVDPGDLQSLQRDQLRQESIVLNVQRACQSAIDLAVHVVGALRLGIPDDTRDAFTRLAQVLVEPQQHRQHGVHHHFVRRLAASLVHDPSRADGPTIVLLETPATYGDDVRVHVRDEDGKPVRIRPAMETSNGWARSTAGVRIHGPTCASARSTQPTRRPMETGATRSMGCRRGPTQSKFLLLASASTGACRWS